MSDYATVRRLGNDQNLQKGDDKITARDKPNLSIGDPSDRLDGWKRIASYLGKDVRTLRRWEKNEGLPIHRLMHGRQGTVYALKPELETWRKTRRAIPTKQTQAVGKVLPRGRKKHAFLIAASVALVVTLIGWWHAQTGTVEYGVEDWVLITQFDNRTGEPELDGTLEYAMERELNNSRHVKVLPRFRINDVLKLMQLPPDTRIDSEIGREISLRDGAVRILINGRIEKLGDDYTVYADLVTTDDGLIQASYATEIKDSTGILPGIRALAGKLREKLGEELRSIRQGDEDLAIVTTPSLEALKLYSQANTMMMGIDRNRAAPVLRQAVRIDPNFASAHLLLWYVLRDRGEMDQAMLHLEKAVELAEYAAERERLFILATYYQFYLDDVPRAIETFELLARIYPDHFWAVSNLASLNEMLGHHERAYPFQLQRADLRPGLGWATLEAVRAAAIFGDNAVLEEYTKKALLLAEEEPWIAPHIEMIPLQRQWIQGEYRSLAKALDGLVSRAGWENAGDSDTVFHSVNSLYLGLGRLDEFLELSQSSADGGSIQPLLEYERGDSAPLNEYLDLAPTNFWTATLLAAAGRTDEARKVLESPESIQQTPRPPLRIKDSRNMAVGELALAEHRHEDAIAVLGESVPMIRFRSKLHYLYGAHSLARAYLAEGRIEDAIATLEQARLEKQWSIYEYAATYFWSRNQLYLIELYDQTGQSLKAEAIVDELRQLLVVADTNHPILIQLEKRSTSPKS